jgi:hypothetical protein
LGCTLADHRCKKVGSQSADAATAAQAAVKDAVGRLSSFSGFVGLSDLCTISSQVCIHLRNEKLEMAQERLGDLLRLFVRVQAEPSIAGLLPSTKWNGIKTDLASIQEVSMQRKTSPRQVPNSKFANHIQLMQTTDILLNELKTQHEHNLGEAHASHQPII